MTTNAAEHYLQKQIENATPAERVVLLYSGAIKFLLKAKQSIEDGNIQERYNNNKRAGDIISYLAETLDMEQGGEVAERLMRIYMFLLRRMGDIDMKNDTSAVDEVVEHLRMLHDSWKKIADGEVSIQASDTSGEDENATKKQGNNSTPRSATA